MSTTTQKRKAPRLRVFALGPCRGDCGPCDSPECPNRATQKVQVVAGSVQTLGYVCDDHYAELIPFA